jgi:hypothetical protein
MDDLCGGETVRRQTSVTDGEAIKIVIHDVDSDSNFSTYYVVQKLVFCFFVCFELGPEIYLFFYVKVDSATPKCLLCPLFVELTVFIHVFSS